VRSRIVMTSLSTLATGTVADASSNSGTRRPSLRMAYVSSSAGAEAAATAGEDAAAGLLAGALFGASVGGPASATAGKREKNIARRRRFMTLLGR